MTQIDQQVYDLYDKYCHGRLDRREFLRLAGTLTVVGGSALAMAQASAFQAGSNPLLT